MKKALSLVGVGLLSISLLFLMGQTRPEELYTYVQGTADVSDATLAAVMITSPGAGLFNHVERVAVACETAAAGGGGIVRLRSGPTVIWQADADAVGYFPIDFGFRGYRQAANISLDLEVGGAATTQATCKGSGVAHVTR